MRNGSLPGRAVRAVGGYLRRHPEEVLRAAKNAATFKLGVPVKALLWLVRELGGSKVPHDLFLQARAPGIYARASFEMMKTPLRGGANIIVQSVNIGDDSILVDLRFEDITLEVTDPQAGTPVAALLQSGALDLSRPGDLLSYMPKRPQLLVAAKGNILTLDLMKHPQLSKERARRLVSVLVPLVGVESIRTDGEHLDVAFSALPGGPGEVLAKIRSLF
jgi:hypothetical protein